MTVQLKYHLQDTAILRYTLPNSISSDPQNILFLAKCGIYRLMTNDHPSLSELYKIRYNEHGGLQLNNYQKILKKRLSALVWDIKDRPDLQLHLLIPQYTGNYFNVCVMISSLKPIINDQDSSKLFSSYNNFAVQHSDLVPLHLDQMGETEIQDLFKIACTENNNGDLTFELSIGVEGIPGLLFEEYHVELGVHEIEVLQSIVNFQLNHYDLPRIQLNDRYAKTIGWDLNDHLISIIEPRKIATFGNERIMLQVLWILQNFHLKHQTKDIEIINPKDGKQSNHRDMYLLMDHTYFIITTKTKHWERVIQSLTLNHKYRKEILTNIHPLENLGVDIIQLLNTNRDLLFNIIKSWVNITSSSRSASYEIQSMLELFDDAFKTYGSEQLAEFQLRMFLKESTFDDLAHPELHNTLVSKYSSIFGHPFFNYKEKINISSPNKSRELWKKDIKNPGIHIIDISRSTQQEQMAIHSFFLILQEARFFNKTWTFHSFDDGLRHSFEKVQQIIQGISLNKSLLHFTHSSSMPFFLRSFELLLFDKDFSTYSVLKAFDAHKLFEDTGDTSLFIYEQSDVSLMKPLDLQMLDILYDRNVIVKLSPEQIEYSHDLYPAKELEEPVPFIAEEEHTPSSNKDEESVFSQPFVEEEEDIVEDFEEDNYIGPDLLFKIPVLATFRSYRQYEFQEIEYTSNLPHDMVQKQLKDLISQNWIETTIKDKVDVFFPLSRGMEYMEDLIKQIPDLTNIQMQLYDTVFPDLENIEEKDKIIDENNILDVLLAIRLSYHDLTEYEERNQTLLYLCSACSYISEKFSEFDNVLRSYYYWTLGVYAAFLGAQLDDKREENLLALKISQIIKLISDILTEKLQDEFTMDQFEASSDEIFVFTENMKEEEQSLKELAEDEEILLTKVDKSKIDRSKLDLKSTSFSPPSVFNIPKAASVNRKIPKSLRQLTPQELRPIEISPDLGPWYKYFRRHYDIHIHNDPLKLSADEIIFMFMVSSINNNSSNSFSIKKQAKSLMFLNEQQVYETASRSPLPMQIDYDNLINTGVIKEMDVGYTIVDIRSILPHPNVSVDPMYKRMNLSEVVDLLDESQFNFVHSGTLQSYIYADFYDLELQPVVAICYAILIDSDNTQEKIDKYSKYIPWAYTMIKLFMMKKRDFMRSYELDFVHETLVSDLRKIQVNSSLELLEYSGEDDTTVKLSFMLRRKLKRLGLNFSNINKQNLVDETTETIPQPMADDEPLERRERITFSPTLIQQIEEKAIADEVADIQQTEERSVDISKKLVKKKSNRSIKVEKIPNKSKASEVIIQSDDSDEIRFGEKVVLSISELCKQAIDTANNTSPTDLLVSIFATIIYPEVIGRYPEITDLRLIELFNEVGELSGVSNTVDFSRNLGDMQNRWDTYKGTRSRIIKSFASRINDTASKFVFNSLFRDLLNKKFKRLEK